MNCCGALHLFPDPYGALGEIDGDQVVLYRRPVLRRTFAVDRLEERVDLLRLSMGAGARMIEAATAGGAVGLVIEAFGRGNGPANLTAAIRRAVERGIVVVVASRCPAGRVKPIYGGRGE